MKLILMGAGYVGMALLRSFHKEHEIYVTTTQADKVDLLKPYAKDVILLTSSKDLENVIELCDGMIVLIAPKNGQSYEETYLNTAKSLSSILEKRKKPFYILYTSSSSVYEGIENEWATEDLVLNPISEKGKILLKTENIFLARKGTCVLRLGGIFGPNREITKRALYFSGKEMPGTGDEPTNHIHLEDIVAGISFCLKHHLTGIYNLVNNDHPTKKELYPNVGRWNSNLSHRIKGYRVSNRKIIATGFNSPMQPI